MNRNQVTIQDLVSWMEYIACSLMYISFLKKNLEALPYISRVLGLYCKMGLSEVAFIEGRPSKEWP